MSVLNLFPAAEAAPNDCTTRFPWWRSLALALLLLVSLGLYIWLIIVSPHLPLEAIDVNSLAQTLPITMLYLACFVPYIAASLLIFLTRSAGGRWRWIELGIILGGALLLRVLLLPLPPDLSRDSWRYVWDARVFVHGYSPYVYAPGNNLLEPLRNFIYANSRYRNVPTLYPPGAQYIFALSYLLAPDSLTMLKSVFVLFDLVSCVVLAILLARKGLDPARTILYAWSPLPIVEFALQGHVDALTVTFTLLALLVSGDQRRRGRILCGFFVGMGALAKIYPLLMLIPLVRLREWKRDLWLVLAFLLTFLLGYLPFFLQGSEQVLGFFGAYAAQQGYSAGVVQQLVEWLGRQQHLPLVAIVTREHIVDVLLMGIGALLVFLLRQRNLISIETGTLALFGLIFSVSSHVFSWYTTAFLPWIALLLPVFREIRFSWLLLARVLALAAPAIFACVSVTLYLDLGSTYYLLAYDPLVAELALALLIYLFISLPITWKRGRAYLKHS